MTSVPAAETSPVSSRETAPEPAPCRGLLLGAGQAHLEFLRQWERRPLPGCELTLLTAFDRAVQRNKLPAGLADVTLTDRAIVDLEGWSQSAGFRLLVDRAIALDPDRKEVTCAHHPAQAYDLVSVNIGSVPAMTSLWQMHRSVLGIKPWLTLPERLQQRLHDWQIQQQAQGVSEPLCCCVAGAGVAGIEIALSLSQRLSATGVACRMTLLDESPVFAPQLGQTLTTRLRKLFEERQLELRLASRVVECDDSGPPELLLADGQRVRSDLTIWAAGSQPAPVCRQFQVARDEQGFLKARSTLQSVSHDHVWVMGGVGNYPGGMFPDSRGFAVRQGRLLYENWKRRLAAQPLKSLSTEAPATPVLDCGDRTALTEFGGLAVRSRLLWWRYCQ